MRRSVILGCVAWATLATSCSSEQNDPPPPTTPEGSSIVDRDPNTGTVDFFAPNDGKKVLAPGGNAEAAAMAWLEEHKDELGVPNPSESFAPTGSTTDEEDKTVHVKLQQKAGGLDVWGVESTLHFDDEGIVDAFDGPYIPNLEAIAKQAPKIDEPTAFKTAEADIRLELPDAQAVTALEQQLVVYVDDDYGSAALARHIRMDVESDTFRSPAEAFVDAMTGKVIESWVDSEMNQVSAEGLDGEKHNVFANGPYSDLPAATPYKLMRVEGEGDSFGKDLGWVIPGNWIGPKNGKWRDILASSLDGPWDRHAVSAMFNVRRAERFYQNEFKWKGPNGKGNTLFLGVHFNLPGNEWNAFAYWSKNGEQDTINFTDRADGKESAVIALDVVGHEFTHLVTAYNSKLVYRRQPGGINESVSDIFGAFIERMVQGRSGNSFLVAEATGEVIRDMRHPRRIKGSRGVFPDNYGDVMVVPAGQKLGRKRNDNGFVHYNSSIVNNAWALQAEGGAHDTTKVMVSEPIGWDKSIKLWWKTQRSLLTRRSNIPRLARVQSVLAQKSKGRYSARGVGCSWMAVNALKADWVAKNLRIACDGNVPDVCAGQRDGAYCDLEPNKATVCKAGHVESSQACVAGSCKVAANGNATCVTPPPASP